MSRKNIEFLYAVIVLFSSGSLGTAKLPRRRDDSLGRRGFSVLLSPDTMWQPDGVIKESNGSAAQPKTNWRETLWFSRYHRAATRP